MCTAALLLFAGADASVARPLRTAVADPSAFEGADAPLAFARIRRVGASATRVNLLWNEVAPTGNKRPPGFNPTNPADPAYHWDGLDRQVRLAVSQGLEPIVDISETPAWAARSTDGRAGARWPDTVELGRFALAAARRYSGRFGSLPRVRYWEAWNEPNLKAWLSPQVKRGKWLAPARYRRMLAEFGSGVRRADPTNVVIGGSTAPFAKPPSPQPGPLAFMRELFCLSADLRPKAHCGRPVDIDAWSHHPYTEGGPTHHAQDPEGVSLGDLPKMRRVLRAAVRWHRVRSRQPLQFWITEFSWDSNPPDPNAVPIELHARWVAEALYRMWRSGVSLVTWWTIWDRPADNGDYSNSLQSGLYFRCQRAAVCDRPKLSLRAFRFPFVAFPSGRSTLIWGRVPPGYRGRVVIEQSSGHKWRRLLELTTDRDGIFLRKIQAAGRGRLRARVPGTKTRSVPFSLTNTPDRPFRIFG